ncbi:hypothetical protein [Taibaiella chishuiensis]|uniref:Group 1 truncated hemoglobin n=1 Tax=Taibaiella chishuiensis TaxID=1434707 RepID=A0A2P8D7N0_9BACT|nr:hypothetical protein [Taibaiella chishuiensis]PSK93199.1 hypothetical protein B0I18_102169 [Taibaiella chishuiensis]
MQTQKTKLLFIIAAMLSFAVILGSCSKDDKPVTPPTPIATSPLYDTLGWFIQGGQGAVEGNGTKMIADPDNSGQTIQAGRLAIRTVVNKALMVIAADTAINIYFPTLLAEVGAGNTTGYAHLRETFTDFVQQAVSGQQIYKGMTMKAAHNFATYNRFGSAAHPTSDEADFNRFIGDVVIAAQSYNVPNSVIAQLGVLLSSVKGDIVY